MIYIFSIPSQGELYEIPHYVLFLYARGLIHAPPPEVSYEIIPTPPHNFRDNSSVFLLHHEIIPASIFYYYYYNLIYL